LQSTPKEKTLNNEEKSIPAAIGAPIEGGFYAGRITIDGVPYALVVAPKAEGENAEVAWLDSEKRVAGADSYNDGMRNTEAMANAGSEAAVWARGLQINGYRDWYLPSQDELEVLYRAFKPTTQSNSLYARSGVNASAVPPTHAYSHSAPAQTTAAAFVEGGEEAFADEWYWSSTQHAADDDCAWSQDFSNGYQNDSGKSARLRARAVRRFAI
jgi:hypothetical protein